MLFNFRLILFGHDVYSFASYFNCNSDINPYLLDFIILLIKTQLWIIFSKYCVLFDVCNNSHILILNFIFHYQK